MFSRKVAEEIGGDCLNLRHRTAERKSCEQTERQDRRQIGRIGRMIYNELTKSTTMENYAYPVRQFAGTTKRVVQTLDLKDDPELVAEYQHWHSREGSGRRYCRALRTAASSKWRFTCSVRAYL